MNFINPQTDYEQIVGKLNSDSLPLWGIMSAQHMLEHLLLVINIGIGKFQVEVVTPEDKLPRTKAFLMSDKPMPREFKAPYIPENDTMPLHYPNFETAKQKLKAGLETFYALYAQNPDAVFPHPVFGVCNAQEWEMIQRKHFTHHFAQFGLL